MQAKIEKIKAWFQWNFDGVTIRFILRNILPIVSFFIGFSIMVGAMYYSIFPVMFYMTGLLISHIALSELNKRIRR